MPIETILNSLTHYKSFVFKKVHLHKTGNDIKHIDIEIIPRKNSLPVCPQCGQKCPTYDTGRRSRRFDFVPLWNIPVFFVYKMRRCTCQEHGVITEHVPWSDGKETSTLEHRQFLANWAQRMSWSEVAECFHTTFGKVHRAVEWLVEWGLQHRDLDGVESLGIDEVQIHKGHKYATLVYQIDPGNKRLLGVEEDRKESSLEHFFTEFDAGTEDEEQRSKKVQWVCSVLWKPYLNVIERVCTKAKNVLDRFHIKGHLTNAVNETRQRDVRQLQSEGREAVLSKSKSIFLKNPENLTAAQSSKLSELLQYNLRVIRSYLLKEDFERFWAYRSGYWAGRFLDDWCCRAMRSRIEPMKRFVGLVRGHRGLLMNWFSSKGMSSGVVEGFNNKVKLTARKSYGFQSFETLRLALFHALGNLPQPKCTHRFW